MDAIDRFLKEGVRLVNGDSYKVLRKLPKNSIDAVVCDPPYEIGYQGASWDRTGVAHDVKFWKLVLRVLKPGGHLLSFSSTRTYHRMTCAIEDAGFQIRDQLGWCYGSGFPKTRDVSKNIDAEAGVKRKKIRVDVKIVRNPNISHGKGSRAQPWVKRALDRGYHEFDSNEPVTKDAKKWLGWSTALKPSWEPICMARKPLSEGSVPKNLLKWGTGALNIDGNRYGPKKHWPANIILDGSHETVDALRSRHADGRIIRDAYNRRLFYVAKPTTAERSAGLDSVNEHTTIKPVNLMRHLIRIVVPKGACVCDPFMGSGSTGIAAHLEGVRFFGIELSKEYYSYASKRVANASKIYYASQPSRGTRVDKSTGKIRSRPLFGAKGNSNAATRKHER